MQVEKSTASADLCFASSHAADPTDAMRDIARDVDFGDLSGALIFASHRYDREMLARAINRNCEGVTVIGSVSSGELTEAGYDHESICFIGFPRDQFRLTSQRFDDVEDIDPVAVRDAVRALVAVADRDSRHLGAHVNHVGIVLVDGLSHREELLTMAVQDALGDVPLIGGSSSDNLAFRDTAIFDGGQFHARSAVIAILSSPRPMHVFTSQHYRATGAKMVVTGANTEDRVVTEINAEPAASEYLRLAGHAGEALGLEFFAAHPPMVRIGGQYHVRSIQSANPDGSLSFYCAIDQGIVLTIGEPLDRLEGMQRLFEEISAQVGSVDRIIAFDCVLNRIDAEQRQLSRQISELYQRFRVVGFNSYGEQFHALHVNQTLSGLAIGR